MIEHAVYKYVHNNDVIYVGKTDSDNGLIKRVYSHSKEDPLFNESEIYVYICKNATQSEFLETALINEYKPLLNSQKVFDFDIEVTGIEWTKWEDYIDEYQKARASIPNEIEVDPRERDRKILAYRILKEYGVSEGTLRVTKAERERLLSGLTCDFFPALCNIHNEVVNDAFIDFAAYSLVESVYLGEDEDSDYKINFTDASDANARLPLQVFIDKTLERFKDDKFANDF